LKFLSTTSHLLPPTSPLLPLTISRTHRSSKLNKVTPMWKSTLEWGEWLFYLFFSFFFFFFFFFFIFFRFLALWFFIFMCREFDGLKPHNIWSWPSWYIWIGFTRKWNIIVLVIILNMHATIGITFFIISLLQISMRVYVTLIILIIK
jgi:hypothetical protein